MEPISPELALIDPALARADRVRLALADAASTQARNDPLTAPRAGAGAAPEPPPTVSRATWPARVLQSLLLCSLMANGILVATVVAGKGADQPALIATSIVTNATPPPARTAAAVDSTAALEQRILAMVIQSPAGRLPPSLIDPRTGLAKNNLQAICHKAQPKTFLCVVRPAQHRPGEGLSVRYVQRHGGSSFTWQPYRRG